MNTLVFLVVIVLVVLYFLKDSEDESLLVKLLRMAKLAPEKPDPEDKQVFDAYMDLAYENLEDSEKAKSLAIKGVEEASKYIKVEEEELVKPKQITANDWMKSPAFAVGIILAALLLLSQCDLKPVKFSVPNAETFKSIVIEE